MEGCLTFELTDGAGEGFETAEAEKELDFLRRRARLAAAVLIVVILVFAAADPLIAPSAAGRLHLLKVPLFIVSVWLWRFALRATSPQALIRAAIATLVFVVLMSAPSTILVGVSWQSLTVAGGIAMGAAALVPWGVRAQVWLILGMLPCALVPMAVLGCTGSAVFPLTVSLCSLGLSIFLAWQSERHRMVVRRSLESFRDNLQRLRLLTENVRGVFWLSELDGALVYVSPRFEDVWGQSCSGLQRRPEAWLDAVHVDDRGKVEAWFRRGAANGSDICEYRLVRLDGVIRWICDARFPIADARGGLWRVARFSLDVTGEREAASARRMQDLARSIQAAVEEERKRVARELHDELGQALTGIKLLLASAEKPVDRPQAEIGSRIRVCINEIDRAMRSVHAMIQTLRPPVLDELGLVAALRMQADAFARHSGIRCEVDAPDEELELSDDEVTTVFRVAQEALTNVARHAHANCVMLRFDVNGDGLHLCVEDDGRGIGAARENFGLRGMRERAAVLHGSLTVESRPEGGTVVRLHVPRPQAAAPSQAPFYRADEQSRWRA